MEEPTYFLFARPSWRSGAARVLDLFGMFDEFNLCEDPARADSIAISLDFRSVGLDLMDAREVLMHEHEQETA